MTARQYLLFCTIQYYPAGGWGDFAGNFDTIEAAEKHAATVKNSEDYEIVDLEKMEVVASGMICDLRKKYQ